jgi:type IV pilus assembly protein PilC
MISYKCSVIDTFGKKCNISHTGNSRKEVIDLLKLQKYTVVEVKHKHTPYPEGIIPRRVKSKELALCCKQIHAMLKSGVTFANALEILKYQTENKRLREYIRSMHEDLQKGRTFSETLKQRKGVFPDIFVSMAEAGELSGNMDVIMDRLSRHYEKEYKTENKIKSAMIYPIILSVVCTVVVLFLITTIMPTFVEMYMSSGVTLPWLTRVLISFSNYLKQYWYLFILGIISLVCSLSYVFKIPNIRIKKDYIKLKIPLLKKLIIKVAASRFSRTLATLTGSGVSLLSALDTVSGVTENLYVGQKILEMKEDVRRGLPLSVLLQNQGIFPPLVCHMVKIGEDSGSLEEMLDKAADFQDEEIDTAVSRLTTLIEPVMIVIMAIIIGFIVLSMVMPMFEMVKTVK